MDEKSPRYDPNFPKSFRLGGGAVGWYAAEIDTWLSICADRSSATNTPTKAEQSTRSAPAPVEAPSSPSPQKNPATQALSAPPKRPLRAPIRKTLAEAVIQGSDLVALMSYYLKLPSWSPAMGCMLISGIAPQVGSETMQDVEGLRDLCDQVLPTSDPKITQAKRLFDEWKLWAEDEDVAPTSYTPAEFHFWCWDNGIDTPWLKLMEQISGSSGNPTSEELINAQLALLLRR
jgi:hypothetical protein